MTRALVALLIPAAALGGCIPPGLGTILEKGVAEYRGGRGEVKEINPFTRGPVLDRFRAFKVLSVERSPDSGPIPTTLPKVIETQLRNALREAKLPTRGRPPGLLIRTRVTTHWRAEGVSQAVSAHSEILARVEFLEEGAEALLAAYYVRGVSTAIARKSDDDLGRGLAEGVVDVILSHRTLPKSSGGPPTLRIAESVP
ncbi:MAG: hypothetical protein ACREMB_03650 [Candidatus Rokuibacteriota bacterium]